MESMADVTIAAAMGMPRFGDGFINLQEALGQLAESVVNEIMGAGADQLCGAAGNSRNGCRERKLATCVGTLTLKIPKLGVGSSFPDDAIERYQRVDRAIVAAVSEMYATGTSTRLRRPSRASRGPSCACRVVSERVPPRRVPYACNTTTASSRTPTPRRLRIWPRWALPCMPGSIGRSGMAKTRRQPSHRRALVSKRATEIPS
jgi:hypothetical protein